MAVRARHVRSARDPLVSQRTLRSQALLQLTPQLLNPLQLAQNVLLYLHHHTILLLRYRSVVVRDEYRVYTGVMSWRL